MHSSMVGNDSAECSIIITVRRREPPDPELGHYGIGIEIRRCMPYDPNKDLRHLSNFYCPTDRAKGGLPLID